MKIVLKSAMFICLTLTFLGISNISFLENKAQAAQIQSPSEKTKLKLQKIKQKNILKLKNAKAPVSAVPGEYVVRYKKSTSIIKNLMNINPRINSRYPDINLPIIDAQIKKTIPTFNVAVLKMNKALDSKKAIELLKKNPNIEIVEPNYIYRINKNYKTKDVTDNEPANPQPAEPVTEPAPPVTQDPPVVVNPPAEPPAAPSEPPATTPSPIVPPVAENPTPPVVAPPPVVENPIPAPIFPEPNPVGNRPNDPLFGQLWGLLNIGQIDSRGQKGVAGVDINAVKAWGVQTGSQDVIVGIIDTGINYKSPDLQDNIWTNQAELNGKEGVDDDNNGYVDDIHGYNFVNKTGDPLDDNSHGSHCAGTIGGKGNDEKGIVGVNWNVKMMALKFLDAEGSGSLDDALLAIEYGVKNGAKILSNSWGGGAYSENLEQAIKEANSANVLFVAAAGNESNDNDADAAYPASYNLPNVISVAAIDNTGEIAEFSNYGKKTVHVGAPGVNIVSTTTKGYESYSGTSMATPHVSGVAALLAAQYPTISNLQIKELILKSARKMKSLKYNTTTGGMVDAYAALMQQFPEPDHNDPEFWNSIDYKLSSEHPYKSDFTQSWEITVPDAKEIAVYFSQFNTENPFDTVELFDAQGNLVQTLYGMSSERFSYPIKGNYVKVVFKTDKSVENYGFDISKVAFR